MSLSFDQNRTSLAPVVWQPEPNKRGTWQILSVCILTTSLCVWSAVHLNIPDRSGRWRAVRRKVYWVGIGLAAPEMIAYTAWYQRRTAKIALNAIRKDAGLPSRPSTATKILQFFTCGLAQRQSSSTEAASPMAKIPIQYEEWSMAHCFYTLMGGYVIIADPTSAPILPKQVSRQILTLDGVRVILKTRPEIFTRTSEHHIKDQSKADGLTKFIVCLQASWFCLQCIGRLAQNLPISLLEVSVTLFWMGQLAYQAQLNTFAHALVAMMIYAFWWNKPLDVETPTVIGGRDGHNLVAWFSMYIPMRELGIADDPRPEVDRMRLYDANYQPRPATLNGLRMTSNKYLLDRGFSSDDVLLKDGEQLLDTGLAFHDGGHGHPEHAILKKMDVERWKSAAPFFTGIGPLDRAHPAQFSTMNISNWPPIFHNTAISETYAYIAFVLAGLIYGGLHGLPWNANFRSVVEQNLWRSSVAVIVGFGPLAVFLLYFQSLARRARRTLDIKYPGWSEVFHRMHLGFLSILLRYCVYLLLGLLGLTYALCRAYLVVESFISLFHAEPGLFDMPNWTVYFPHLT